MNFLQGIKGGRYPEKVLNNRFPESSLPKTAFEEYHRVRCKTLLNGPFWHNPWERTSLSRCFQPLQKEKVALDFGSDKCFVFS